MDLHDALQRPFVLWGTELAMPNPMLHKMHSYIERGLEPSKTVRDEMTQMNAERNAALVSMDRAQIVAYAAKWGVDGTNMPTEEDEFWSAVHMARTGVSSLTMADRRMSKLFLQDRGLPSFDGGEVKL